MPVVVIGPPRIGKVVAILVSVPVFVVYPAEVFSASVQTSKQDSTAPEASTPKGELPAPQFAPLAFKAVARLARPVRLP